MNQYSPMWLDLLDMGEFANVNLDPVEGDHRIAPTEIAKEVY